MNMRSLASGLLYRGEVEALRQTYYVFQGRQFFFVMSLSKSKHNAGNFNLVQAEGVEYLAKRLAGQKDVTAKYVAEHSKKPQYISTALDALNILYVLVAIRRAKIDTRFRTRELHFNVRE
jgi:hypothetical protein